MLKKDPKNLPLKFLKLVFLSLRIGKNIFRDNLGLGRDIALQIPEKWLKCGQKNRSEI